MEKLKTTRWLKVYHRDEDITFFNSFNLEYLTGNQEVLELLNFCKQPKSFDEVIERFKEEDNLEEVIGMLKEYEFLVDVDKDEQKEFVELKKGESSFDLGKLNSVRVVLTEDCNMGCDYCFVASQVKERSSLSEQDIKKVIDLLVEINKGSTISIQFFGGEPLLNFELLKSSVEYADSYVKKGQIEKVNYSISTNGTLITPEMADFFKEYDFFVKVSLDGEKSVNDRARTYGNGKGTFDDAIKGYKILKDKKVRTCFLVTPNKGNLETLATGIEYLATQYGCDNFELNSPQPTTEGWDIDGAKLATEISKALEFARENDIRFYSLADRILEGLSTKEKQVYSCARPNGDWSVALSPKGLVSYCIVCWSEQDFCVPLKDFIPDKDFLDWKKNQLFNTPACMNCSALSICGGPCSLENYYLSKSGKIDKEKCAFFRKFLEWAVWV